MHYIPMDLHPKMTPAFHHGYILVLEAIFHIILKDPTESDTTSVIPTISTVTQRLQETQEAASHPDQSSDEETKTNTAIESQCIQIYLDSGGKVDYALDALTDLAFEKSPAGTLYHQEELLRQEDAEFEKEVAALPRCENDSDFGLVREKLGISRDRIGPHWYFLTDSEGEDGEEDEDWDGEEAVYEGVLSGQQ